ncbi:receptor kinase-like protein Xa21 isoform X1 [Nymphaea colorata]|uniref:receptor kinase-like protein Xa21 isoform X1 n=1 Tax=Nymphaea colorata TaxID=210225 RepID=UPI00129D80F5|nr:receptor kinase-like protein Xa21 isoform X1 [Nymphaea colorata]
MASFHPTLIISLALCWYLLLATLILQSSICQSAGTTMNPSNVTDESALLSFKSKVTHDPYAVLSSWTPNVSFCAWTGVWCSRRRQRVVELNLTGMALEGTLSPDIANLSFLQVLSLRNNSFRGDLLSVDFDRLFRLRVLRLSLNELEGTIPQSLGRCSSLESLILSYNKFTGSIPPWLGGLPNLKTLSLGYNLLGGTIPPALGNLSKLEYLHLTQNNLAGNIPGALGELSNLNFLSIGLNKLTGAIPRTLGNLSALQTLELYQNGLSGEIPYELGSISGLQILNLGWNFYESTVPSSIFNISSLQSLTLTYSRLFGQLPANIGQTLPNLEELVLPTNNFSGRLPASLANASMLRTIEVGVNNFDGPMPMELGNLPNLETLKIWQTNVTNAPGDPELSFLNSLTKCRILKVLILSQNRLRGTLPASIGNLSTNLRELHLAENQIQGRIPSEIVNLTNLTILSMGGNNFNGVIPENIGQLRNLQKLSFYGNMLEGSIPNQLYSLENLGELYLYRNQFSGSISDAVQNLTNLAVLYLQSNNLSSAFPSGLWRLENLRLVDLSQNFLIGSLPTDVVRSSASLSCLDLSANKLSGSLPGELSKLQMLQTLNFSWNSFQGLIPPTFGSLVAIETIDLSHNSIDGTIPESLASLKNLHFLDLSFNQLEGEIPNHGIFTKLNADSFKGNPALCGAPMFQVRLCPTRSNRKTKARTIVACIVAGILVGTISCVLSLILCRRKRTKTRVPEDDSPRIERPIVSYLELSRATESFSEKNLLGSGSFGSVYRGTLHDGTVVAVKVLNMHVEGANKTFDAECEVLRKVKHRNLVKIITACTNLEFRALVFEYMPNGNLDEWLFSGGGHRRLNLLERVDIMVDVACALEYLHHDHPEPIVHCDLKPNNILLDDNMTAHVADFGIAKMLLGNKSSTLTSVLGTMGYIAPEFGLAGKVTTKVDVYSYGILLLETFTGKRPTDAMFGGDLSLRQWVAAALTRAISNVVDDSLLLLHHDALTNSTSDEQRSGTDDSMALHEILVPIMEIGLSCSKETPEDRMTMREVVASLKKVRGKMQDLRVFPSTSATAV